MIDLKKWIYPYFVPLFSFVHLKRDPLPSLIGLRHLLKYDSSWINIGPGFFPNSKTIGHLRVTMGHPRLTIGYLKAPVVHIRLTLGSATNRGSGGKILDSLPLSYLISVSIPS